MNTTVVVRPVTETDADSLGRVHAACWHESYDHILSKAALSQLHPERLAQMWRRFSVQGPGYRHVVAELDGEIVGFVGVGPGREQGHETSTELYFLYVSPYYRRQGVGSALMATADADYMWIWEGLKKTRKYYEKRQYKPDIVRATRGMGTRSRASKMFGAYHTEFKLMRPVVAATAAPTDADEPVSEPAL